MNSLERKQYYEKQLEQWKIFHYHSVVMGCDAYVILNVLKNILKYFEQLLNCFNGHVVSLDKMKDFSEISFSKQLDVCFSENNDMEFTCDFYKEKCNFLKLKR